MQILALSVGDRIVIGDVKLVVLERNRNNVKLGLDAPADVVICRAEAKRQFGKRRMVPTFAKVGSGK